LPIADQDRQRPRRPRQHHRSNSADRLIIEI
jgi:hypothetical protein